MKKMVLILFFFGYSTGVFAQQKHKVFGYLKDSITHDPIVLASVTNLSSHRTVMTSSAGKFNIELRENEILSFAAVGYYFDTIQYHQKPTIVQDSLVLFLAPLTHSLGNITVTSYLNSYIRDSLQRRKEFLQDIVNYTIPTLSSANAGAGIALNMDRFSKKEKNKRKALAFFEASEREAYINYRFPAATVIKYSSLKDETLQNFMQQHRPSYEWLRLHLSEEDIKYYINEKLKESK